MDIGNHVAHSRSTVFGSYIVAKPVFWREWLKLANLLFEEAENPASELFDLLNEKTSYQGGAGQAGMKVFIQERLACVLLASGKYRVANEINTVDDGRANRLLNLCDLLKQEYCESENDECLIMYQRFRAKGEIVA